MTPTSTPRGLPAPARSRPRETLAGLALLLPLLLPLLLLAACAEDPGAAPQITTALPEAPEPPDCPVPPPEAMNGPGLRIASFTVDNLGVYSSRQNRALACLLGSYDLVAIHDLAVPPYPGSYADGEPYRPDPASAGFFDAMRQLGFAYAIGPEDTGPGQKNKLTSGVNAWPAVFYKPAVLQPAGDRPSGYIEPDRSANPSYDFVPFALPLRTADGRFDFLLVTAKLAEKPERANRRRDELWALTQWIAAHGGGERDVLLLADTSFASCGERDGALPAGWSAIDGGCRILDVARKKPSGGAFLLAGGGATVEAFDAVPIVEAMYPFWTYDRGGDYPGSPYNPALFDQYYSGSTPMALRLLPPAGGDQD